MNSIQLDMVQMDLIAAALKSHSRQLRELGDGPLFQYFTEQARMMDEIHDQIRALPRAGLLDYQIQVQRHG